jgi:hypothetical protein
MYIHRPALIIAFIPINVNRQTFLVMKVGNIVGSKRIVGSFSRVTLYKTGRKLKTSVSISSALIAVHCFFDSTGRLLIVAYICSVKPIFL